MEMTSHPEDNEMKRKKNFFDIIAACAFVFNVDWDDEYELLEVDDIFWETAPSQDSTEENIIFPDTRGTA